MLKTYVHPHSLIDLGMPWVQTLLLLVIEIRMIRSMSKVLIRTRGFAYTSSADQCRPTKFMYASTNSLMLTSGSKIKKLAIGSMRFGNPVTRTLS
jgi:hypothetical protein